MSRFVVFESAQGKISLVFNVSEIAVVKEEEDGRSLRLWTTADTDLEARGWNVRCTLDRFIRLVDAKDLRGTK